MSETAVGGVYFLFRQRKLVYVGRSQDCPQRIRSHAANGRPFDAAFFMAIADQSDAAWVETACIRALEPRQNKRGKEKPGPVIVGPPTVLPGPVVYQPQVVRFDPDEWWGLPAIRQELRRFGASRFVAALKAGEIPGICKTRATRHIWMCRGAEVFAWKNREIAAAASQANAAKVPT